MSRVGRFTVTAHFEEAPVADNILNTTVGETVLVTLQAPGTAALTETLYAVDGVTWRIGVLSPVEGTVSYQASYTLFPPPVRLYWRVGTRSTLGSDTALAPEQPSPDTDRLWARDDLVTRDRFITTIACLRLPTYDTVADRDQHEAAWRVRGTACYVLDVRQKQVWTGSKWIPVRAW